MSKPWKSHEQAVNKSRQLRYEKVINKLWTSNEQVMNKSWTSDDQEMNKWWTIHEQN